MINLLYNKSYLYISNKIILFYEKVLSEMCPSILLYYNDKSL